MKKLLVIAVAAALAAPAAMADTTLYGKLHASVGSVKTTTANGVGGTNSTTTSAVESHSSRIGIKGATALDNGMEATYGLEYGVALDGDNGGSAGYNAGTFSAGPTGTGRNTDNSLTTRNQFVGLKGKFGEVRVGKHDTPAKLATAGQDVFADTYADMSNIITADSLRVNNAVAYINKFGPVGFAIAHSTGPLGGDNDTNATTGMVNYSNGPWYAGLGHTHMNGYDGGDNPDMTNLGLGWKAEAGHAVNVVLEQDKAGSYKEKAALINGVYKIGNVGLKAQYGERKVSGGAAGSNGKQKLSSVGVDYDFGKKTSAYLLFSDNKNPNKLEDPNASVAGTTTRVKAAAVGLVTEF